MKKWKSFIFMMKKNWFSVLYILVLILPQLVIDCFELLTFIPLIFNPFLLLLMTNTLSKMKLKKCLSSKLPRCWWDIYSPFSPLTLNYEAILRTTLSALFLPWKAWWTRQKLQNYLHGFIGKVPQNVFKYKFEATEWRFWKRSNSPKHD